MIISPRKILSSITQPLLAMALGLLFCLVLIEVVLRIFGLFYKADVSLSPHQVRHIASRSKDLEMNKKSGEIVILAEGASYTRGVGAPSDQSYSIQLQNLLGSKLKGKKVTVINKGITGQNTTGLRLHLAEHLDQIKPDLLIVLIGMANRSNRMGYELYADAKHSGFLLSNVLHEIRIYRLLNLLINDYSVAASFKEASVPEAARTIPADVRAAMERVNSDPTIAFDIARYFNKISEADKALSWFQRGLAGRPRDDRNYCGIINHYRSHGLFDQCLLYGERVIAENPRNFDSYFCLAYLHVDLSHYDNALDLLEKGLNAYPDFAPGQAIKIFALRDIFERILQSEKEDTVRRSRAIALYRKMDAKAPGYFFDPTVPAFIKKRDESPARKPPLGALDLLFGNIDLAGWRKFDLEEIVKIARAKHVPIFLQTYPNANYPEINRVAQEWSVPLVDHFQVFNDMWKTGKVDRYDFFENKTGWGGHCNARGYGVMAENIFKKLVEEQIAWVVH